MSIQLFVSNSLNKLSGQLGRDQHTLRADVFIPTHLVTQTEGINNWLKLQLADHLGITANYKFMKPSELVSNLYFMLVGPQKPPMNESYLKWNIYQWLGENDFSNQFPTIATYFSGNDVKRIALAGKLADLYDQYQVYRPDLILKWNDETLQGLQASDWQEWLWKKLHLQMKDILKDKASLVHEIIEALKDPQKQAYLKKKMPVLNFFGLAVITPYYLKLYHALGQYIDIRFYLVNPAPHAYWLEDRSELQIARLMNRKKVKPDANDIWLQGNSLLLNWGTIMKESFSLLLEQEEFMNNYQDGLSEAPNEPHTLLEKIQYDVFHNLPQDQRQPIFKEDLQDGSITINACYTRVREVEVLYNYLVQLVDEKKESLSPRDIVVMVSDIDAYAPFIHAVFKHAPYQFPYVVADEMLTSGNNLFTALQQILLIDADSFKAEAVMELLESPYIRKRFGITDTDKIRTVLQQAGIRFSIDGNREDETRTYSWNYGLQRMMLGLCISGGQPFDTGEDILLPLDTVEGHDAMEIVRCFHFVKVLEYYVKGRNQQRSLLEWTTWLKELVEDLIFESGEQEDEDFHRFVAQMDQWSLLETDPNLKISYEVFCHSFLDRVGHESRAHSFATGGITFCSLIPMRSIPFKVVAMLGIDFDKFPRQEIKLSFSLLEKEHRKGDRNVKGNDQHLFLETVLSAKKYFYLSYIGRSAKNNTIIPPSSLVDELVDYILKGLQDEKDLTSKDVIQVHPLHGFSRKYFSGNQWVNYLSDEKYRQEIPVAVNVIREQNFSTQQIALHDWTNFFKDPIKWYFNKVLRIWYHDKEVLLPGEETFELDRLDEWSLQQTILFEEAMSLESFREEGIRAGNLPLRNMGRYVIEQQQDQVAEFKSQLHDLIKGATPATLDITVDIEGTIISGQLNHIYNNTWIAINTSKDHFKFIAGTFVSYILSIAQGNSLSLTVLSKTMQEPIIIPAGTISEVHARELLIYWMKAYKSGFEEPYLFYPSMLIKPLDLEKFDYSKFEKELVNKVDNARGKNGASRYLVKAFDNGFFNEDNFEIFRTNMLSFFKEIQVYFPQLF